MAHDLDDDELRATRKLNGVEWDEDKQIQVGDFVRLDRNQGINKIIEIEDKRYILDEDIADEYGDITCVIEEYQLKDEILKYSPNLIDLIEVGDYVNGEKVSNIDCYDNIYTIEWEYGNVYTTEIINDKFITDIVTHEQFNSVMYKVKE